MIERIFDSYKQLEVLLKLIAQNLEQIYEDIKQYQSSRPDVSAHSAGQALCHLKLTALHRENRPTLKPGCSTFG